MKGQTFKVDLGFIERFADKTGKVIALTDKTMQKNVITATNMIWRVAHQKRPMMSKAAFNYERKHAGRTVRVSDPSAELGVPVRTGALQGSIQQEVTRSKTLGWQGRIWTKGIPYAMFIEKGTSKMAARPFMQPAIDLNLAAIKKLFLNTIAKF